MWEDEPSTERYGAERKRLHKLYKHRERELEKADWEEEEYDNTL